jgi:formamidopyrimidine-DNA glycosylase
VPELPEVESLRLSLLPLIGRRIASVRLYRPDIATSHDGSAIRPRHLLSGATVTELRRHGKQLAIIAGDGRVLIVHLGMSGQLLLIHRGSRPQKTDHIHSTWTLNDHSSLHFRDPRRFGGLWVLPSADTLADRWSTLGPDALDVSASFLAAATQTSQRAIKALLLDQAVLAGVGNIYADESLFLSRIRPDRPANGLNTPEIAALAKAVRTVLRRAIRAGGSTLRDYANAAGEAGTAQKAHAVYGLAGKPCSVCDTTLIGSVLAQRTTVHCPRCQR